MENNKIQEMQILEQNMNNLLLQKQAFQIELSETESAIFELDKSGEEVFKIVGQIMVKTNKDAIKKELLEKQKILNMKLKSLEKQELPLSNKIEELRGELLEDMNKNEK